MSIEIKVFDSSSESLDPSQVELFDNEEISVGRAAENDLVINQDEVSGSHCLIRIREFGGASTLFVTDLASSNGTYFDRERLNPFQEVEIGPKGRIIIGSTVIQVSVPGESSEAPSLQELTEIDEAIAEVDELREEEDKEQEDSAAEEEAKPLAAELELVHSNAPKNEKDEKLKSENSKEMTTPDVFTTEIEASTEADFIEVEALALLSIKGRVMNGSEPLAEAKIVLSSGDVLLTSEDGSFEFHGALEGEQLELFASKPGFLFEQSSYQLVVGDEDELLIQSRKLVELKGQVQHRGKALAGVEVRSEEYGAVLTDDSGSFVIPDVPEGERVVLSFHKEGFSFRPRQVEAEQSERASNA